VNPTRLFVLGALARHGPMYGHQIRRDARIDRTELWSEVKPGSLYAALHRLQDEGLIEPVRTEQQGNLPARTVYAITGEGRRELRALRAEALREVALRPDPVDLALAVSADLDEDTLRAFFASRRDALATRAAFFARERDQAWPDQTVADDLIIDHIVARIETELRWHDLVLDRIGKLAAGAGNNHFDDAGAGGAGNNRFESESDGAGGAGNNRFESDGAAGGER
jgi:DNA-binding PadR family transcriptional regulator